MLFLSILGASAHAGGQGSAPATEDDRSARVDEALRLSDARARLAAIRARLLAYLDGAQASPETRRWTAGSLRTAYAPDLYLARMRQALLDEYDADALTRVLAWYRSPAGRKIARLERAAQAPGQETARSRYLAGLEERPPSDYRLVLLFSVDEASRTSAATASALRASMDGWSLGTERLGERPEVREIEAAIRKHRAELRDDVADHVLRELTYAYREASDGDLRAYAEFMESAAGRWFIGTAFKAHQALFADAADQVADDLVGTATRRQTAPPPSAPPRFDERSLPPAPGPSRPARP